MAIISSENIDLSHRHNPKGTTTPEKSKPWSYGKEVVRNIPQSSRTEALQLNAI